MWQLSEVPGCQHLAKAITYSGSPVLSFGDPYHFDVNFFQGLSSNGTFLCKISHLSEAICLREFWSRHSQAGS